MSFISVAPESVVTAASNLAGLGSALSQANMAATGKTTQVLAAAEDEVSTAIATLFGQHAQEYQALSAQAAAFHDRFVAALSTGAGAYAAADAVNAGPLQPLLDLVNAPTEALFGRPLIGDGANGLDGTGANGGAGGILYGNGGKGGSGASGKAGRAARTAGAGTQPRGRGRRRGAGRSPLHTLRGPRSSLCWARGRSGAHANIHQYIASRRAGWRCRR
ncbi:PE-PGRS family protein PE_PGRS17 [Mycobacterium simulans]|uniref:PE-PGRS family protein PE_PGRS17 n=1 Tax=Mycobacterium simulans TaxID=627089 RepID=A0A7Z7IJE5_9MYCO|nr:PE family protein [Mycobacterium simulans]SOJ54693.1 PE-PGRS family protein PE_PGRS17 [Mycobacterium simulans]